MRDLFYYKVKAEKLKAKARGYVRAKLQKAFERATEALKDPTVSKRKVVETLVHMVYWGLISAQPVVKLEATGEVSDGTMEALLRFLRSDKAAADPPPPRSVGLCVQPQGGPRDPALKGSKAVPQQVKHMKYRRHKGLICEPAVVTKEALAAYKKAMRIE